MSDAEPTPLFVRIPAATARRLELEVAARGASKRQVVTELLGQGLSLGGPRLMHGHAEVISDTVEVLTLGEAADLLKVDVEQLRAACEAGQVPGRRIGDEWRFARAALLVWLGDDVAPAERGRVGSARGSGAVGFGAAAPAAAGDDAPRGAS